MDTLIYLLKSSVLLILFYVIYLVLLKRDTYHQFKRVYLLSGLVLSAVLPWIYYTKTVAVPKQNFSENSLTTQKFKAISNISTGSQQVSNTFTFSWDEVLLIVYIVVAFVLLLRLVFQFFKLYQFLKLTPCQKADTYILHIVEKRVNPFSFFKHMFVSRTDYESENFEMIRAHENVHIKQYHSVDILLANVFCILFWFNPIAWFYKKSSVQNLEHIADDISVKMLSDKVKYQYLLLNHTFQDKHLQSLQTTFFQSSIKQRIMMLNKSNTSKIYALKSIVVLPVLVLLFINFQSKIVAQQKEHPKDVNAKLDGVKYSGGTGSITTIYGGSLKISNLKPGHVNFAKNSIILKDTLGKDERVVVKINRYASREYLEMTKRYLKKRYNIDVIYSDLKYNDKKELISIQAKADCNDGFTGSITRKNNQPVEEFYIYRDYSTVATIPFGLGDNLPSSLASGKTSKDASQITYTTSVMLSPSVKGYSEIDFKNLKDDSNEISVPVKQNETSASVKQVDLKNVKTFIINGKSYKLPEIKSKFMVVNDFEFIDDETFQANGDVIYGDAYFDYLKSQSKDKKDIYVEKIDVIMFSDNKATFFHLREVKVTQEASEKE